MEGKVHYDHFLVLNIAMRLVMYAVVLQLYTIIDLINKSGKKLEKYEHS